MRELLLVALLLLQQVPSPTGIVSGTVLYSDGTPAGALILRLVPLSEPGQQQPRSGRLVTDANGVFNQRVAAGRYVLQTVDTNPTFYPGVPTQDGATPLIVTAGSTTSGLNFSLPPSASGVRVQGHVTLPQSYPVAAPGLRIVLTSERSAKPLAADGTFEFTHVMPVRTPCGSPRQASACDSRRVGSRRRRH